MLGAFYWGYLVTQVAAGWLAMKIGGKRVFGWSMFITTIATVLTPIAAKTHYIFLMVLRIIIGMASVSDINEVRITIYPNKNIQELSFFF